MTETQTPKTIDLGGSLADLPQLVGSEKQVAWAKTLRAKTADSLYSWLTLAGARVADGHDTPERFAALKSAYTQVASELLSETSAKRWIALRDTDYVRIAKTRTLEMLGW